MDLVPRGNPSGSHSNNLQTVPYQEDMFGKKRQINLLRGWPSPSLLPPQLLSDAAQAVLTGKDQHHDCAHDSKSLLYDDLALKDHALLYGHDEGHRPLRDALAAWLVRFYRQATRKAYHNASAYHITFDRIAITGGASQSLGVIMTSVTDPSYTRNVWVVAPGYFMAFKILQDAGFATRLRAIPETSEGPDVSYLRQELKKCETEWTAAKAAKQEADEPLYKPKERYPKTYKHIIYTVPAFANPSSITTSLGVREDLVRCAREFDALVVCDDVYDMLQWPASTDDAEQTKPHMEANLPRLVDVDRYLPGAAEDGFGNVVSNGTFSKISGPGVRCGWVEATGKLAFLLSQAGTTKSGGAPSQMTSTFLCELLQNGQLDNHILNMLCPAYNKRWTAMMSAIERWLLPLGMTVVRGADSETAGGYFIWLVLPEILKGKALEVTKRTQAEENLIVAGGKLSQIPDDNRFTFDSNIRLCFAWEAEQELVDGVERLARVIGKMIEEPPEGSSNRNGSHEDAYQNHDAHH